MSNAFDLESFRVKGMKKKLNLLNEESRSGVSFERRMEIMWEISSLTFELIESPESAPVADLEETAAQNWNDVLTEITDIYYEEELVEDLTVMTIVKAA